MDWPASRAVAVIRSYSFRLFLVASLVRPSEIPNHGCRSIGLSSIESLAPNINLIAWTVCTYALTCGAYLGGAYCVMYVS